LAIPIQVKSPEYYTYFLSTETLEDHTNFLIDFDELSTEVDYISNYDKFDKKSITWNIKDKHSYCILYFKAFT
jgi:hypothetical protein